MAATQQTTAQRRILSPRHPRTLSPCPSVGSARALRSGPVWGPAPRAGEARRHQSNPAEGRTRRVKGVDRMKRIAAALSTLAAVFMVAGAGIKW